MLPMEAEREEAGELPGEEDRSRGEMRFSCPLAARCGIRGKPTSAVES